MDIVIDLTSISEFLSLPANEMLWRMFWLFGWIPIAIVFLWGAKEVWLTYIRGQWMRKQKFIVLAIDIPRGNEQSPRAVENMFSYIAGAHASINLIEKYWEGKFQLSFSYEIVSIEGYTQFLVHLPTHFRNLVESSIYAQYPDAEITEVDDYTSGVPTKFPDDQYDVWGVEYILAENSMYPIKTYEDFEHQMGPPETHYKDPMAALMDLNSSLGKGEQLWYQIIVIPIGFDWPKKGEEEIDRILGQKPKATFLNNFIDKIVEWISEISEMIYQLWGDIEDKNKKEEEDRFRMMNLKPGEKIRVEGVQEKIGKLGFEFKIRVVYLAKKEVLNKNKVGNGFTGYMKQFASLDLNNIKPDMKLTVTKTEYFFRESRLIRRKNNIINNYINRDDWGGKKPGIMNVEELASIWHFPVESVVKAPLIQKAPGRKAEPPMALPIGEEIVSEEILEPIFEEGTREIRATDKFSSFEADMAELDKGKEKSVKMENEKSSVKGKPPANLPLG
ncbi:MAG: hypothetical protein ABIG60_01725 [Patescibacteria group bacterium]